MQANRWLHASVNTVRGSRTRGEDVILVICRSLHLFLYIHVAPQPKSVLCFQMSRFLDHKKLEKNIHDIATLNEFSPLSRGCYLQNTQITEVTKSNERSWIFLLVTGGYFRDLKLYYLYRNILKYWLCKSANTQSLENILYQLKRKFIN
jgi:hypothetical protein